MKSADVMKCTWSSSGQLWNFSFFDLLSFFWFLGSGSGLKMLLGPVRSFSRSRFLISSIPDPFRLNFCLLDPPLNSVFLQDRDSVFLEDRDSVCLEDRDCCCSQQEDFLYVQKKDTVVVFHRENFCMFEKQRILFFCNKKIQSKSFISPLWWICFALGREKSVESHPNLSHRNSESSNVFEK